MHRLKNHSKLYKSYEQLIVKVSWILRFRLRFSAWMNRSLGATRALKEPGRRVMEGSNSKFMIDDRQPMGYEPEQRVG